MSGEIGTREVIGGDDNPSYKSASADVLTFVGGKDENIDDRNSVFPDEAPNVLFFIDLPLDDTMFYGDGISELPEHLVDAVSGEKHVDGLNGGFRHFRFKNSLQIGYDTTADDKIKNDTIEITVNSRKQRDAVVVTDKTTGDTHTAPLNFFLPNPEPPSYTILADDWKSKSDIFNSLFDSQKKREQPPNVGTQQQSKMNSRHPMVQAKTHTLRVLGLLPFGGHRIHIPKQ